MDSSLFYQSPSPDYANSVALAKCLDEYLARLSLEKIQELQGFICQYPGTAVEAFRHRLDLTVRYPGCDMTTLKFLGAMNTSTDDLSNIQFAEAFRFAEPFQPAEAIKLAEPFKLAGPFQFAKPSPSAKPFEPPGWRLPSPPRQSIDPALLSLGGQSRGPTPPSTPPVAAAAAAQFLPSRGLGDKPTDSVDLYVLRRQAAARKEEQLRARRARHAAESGLTKEQKEAAKRARKIAKQTATRAAKEEAAREKAAREQAAALQAVLEEAAALRAGQGEAALTYQADPTIPSQPEALADAGLTDVLYNYQASQEAAVNPQDTINPLSQPEVPADMGLADFLDSFQTFQEPTESPQDAAAPLFQLEEFADTGLIEALDSFQASQKAAGTPQDAMTPPSQPEVLADVGLTDVLDGFQSFQEAADTLQDAATPLFQLEELADTEMTSVPAYHEETHYDDPATIAGTEQSSPDLDSTITPDYCAWGSVEWAIWNMRTDLDSETPMDSAGDGTN
ncbi:hypothetical protein S7711_11324 [Stachybotrys chartarum IBT 7711]|uniref:Uncharacterized protein n=1 Tax=Stachybotrys chartarum (strain CBS 109288 / IBT 7711) TaxID=1280523 RepID=A0A084AHQ7_STACB|nr:hypothetical protein S7711_11324 [Stachybotrys chartarum IBT 7711]